MLDERAFQTVRHAYVSIIRDVMERARAPVHLHTCAAHARTHLVYVR